MILTSPGLAAALLLSSTATAQKIGTTPEVHPTLQTQLCTVSGGCETRSTKLVADSLAHPILSLADPSKSCLPLDPALCPDQATCASNCAIHGTDYTAMGVLTSASALTLRQYLFDGQEYKRVSPRLYLLAEDAMNYEPLKLINAELSFDVDVSQLACGMNGALYLSEMDMSGSRSDLNPAGAQYGTGYCDAQCFSTPAFINGLVRFTFLSLSLSLSMILPVARCSLISLPPVQLSFMSCTNQCLKNFRSVRPT